MLRALLAEWVDLGDVQTAAEELFGYEPAWQHLASLVAYTLVVLAFALLLVHHKAFPVNTDS